MTKMCLCIKRRQDLLCLIIEMISSFNFLYTYYMETDWRRERNGNVGSQLLSIDVFLL
jgi:hypothetical protein